MLKNYKIIVLVMILLFFISLKAISSPIQIDMGRVFYSGIICSLYGATLIGGGNAIIILMSDDTKSNLYRIKYGIGIGTILGLIYGTVVGLKGLPLVPTFGTDLTEKRSNKNNILTHGLLMALGNLQITEYENNFSISTKIFNLTF